MKKGVLKIVFAVLFLLPVCANATIVKDFYTDGQIVDGNVFDTVNVWNTANVTMTGGEVVWCNVYDSGIFTYNSGDIGFVYAYDSGSVYSYGTGMGGVDLYQNSQAHLYNGDQGIHTMLFDNVELHIHGYNLEYIINGPDWVKGFWPDGRSFGVFIRNSSNGALRGNVFLHEIPEPSSGLLFMSGMFLTRFKRKKGGFKNRLIQ
jgi:hypothetical protein